MNNYLEEINWVKGKIDSFDFGSVEKVRSAEQNTVLKLTSDKGSYILKIGPNLKDEKDRLAWLEDKLPIPRLLAWESGGKIDKLLMTYIEGNDLADSSDSLDESELVNMLADALHLVHRIDITNCPFGKVEKAKVFVHGDACLPNFIYKSKKLAGIIDLGGARIDIPDIDLAAAVWSLNFNFGVKLEVPFLKAYGDPEPTHERAKYLIERYESDWSERFRSL